MNKEKQRNLTEAEQARLARLQVLTKELEEKGYRRVDHTIGIVYANVMAIVLAIPFAILFGSLFVLRFDIKAGFSFSAYLIWLGALIVLTFVHEGIHGITWGAFASGGYASIRYGFMKEYMTPYCTCMEPLGKREYILGTIMPGLVLGIIPCILSLFIGSGLLLAIGLIMVAGAGGDLTIILKMLRYHTSAEEVIILDHPSECGFITFEKQES